MKIGDRHQLREPSPPPLRRRKLVPVPNFRKIRCLTPIFLAALAIGPLAADLAVAQAPPTLAEAQREAAAARQRSDLLEAQPRRATGEAARANAAAAALA